ncbi:MAG: hypothetical protein J6586_11440, partial [Snodgrassella sp.]|nr:hypothetical protein [Snodgrassella sp.]
MLPHKETGTPNVKTDRLIDQPVCFFNHNQKHKYFILCIISLKISIAGYFLFIYNKTYLYY